MTEQRRNRHTPATPHERGGFTLAELLVSMAIIAVLATITVVAVRGISRDARLSSGVNAVVASLDNARSLAMKRNKIVMCAFRARLDGPGEQRVEIVTAEWSGDSYPALVTLSQGDRDRAVDRFVPIPDVATRSLPAGIKVAAPAYGAGEDLNWLTQSHLPNINQVNGSGEWPGYVLAVIYAPDGTTMTQNLKTNSYRVFVDFDTDGWQDVAGTAIDYSQYPTVNSGDFNQTFFRHVWEFDEPFVSAVPFLSVFDDELAREIGRVSQWNNEIIRTVDLTAFITERADRIHFNRYTGVAMR